MSDGTPPWDSLTHRLAKLRSAAESIERLAADYLLALRPVREALQAVADSPFADRDRWAGAVSNLAARMSENGMADVPKSLEDVDRWNLQFDAGKPGRAFAGKAFCNALAAEIADGASRGSFFVTLDQHSFITTSAAMQEVCAVLSRLLYVHTERTAPRFTKCYGEILIEVGIDGETLRLRLAQFGTSLSSEAASAVHDWDECSSGIPFYRVDIRPEAECMGATNGPERSEEREAPDGEEAPEDDSAFRPATEMLKEPYGTYKALKKALVANPWIKSRQPRMNRLLIHAGDWSKFVNSQSPDPLDTNAAVVDAVLAAQQRRDTIRKEKRGK